MTMHVVGELIEIYSFTYVGLGVVLAISLTFFLLLFFFKSYSIIRLINCFMVRVSCIKALRSAWFLFTVAKIRLSEEASVR